MDQTKKSRRNLPSIDRLSALPEGIICHILSFLPTKTSLLTSILARRWRYLWANVPNLDFDSTSHHSETSFTSIITRVMCLHKVQRINTFRLCYKDGCSLYEFETLIVVVISRDVHVLDICLDYQVILPRCLFTCKTLVDLKLERCVINSLTGAAIFLPCLKKLRLFYVKYDVGENLAKLFTGCPVLEELFMKRLEDDGLVGCKIFSPTIKLIVLDFAYNPLVHDNHEHKVDLNAPALSYLQLKGFSSTHISSQMLTSLTQVDVSFGDDPCAYEENCFLSVLFFIFSLSNMKCLKLAFPYELDLDGSLIADNLPETNKKLAKLKKLEFDADVLFLPNLLACADNLEVLIIREDVLGWWWQKPEEVPTCLLSHLRSVRIDGFGYRCHFKMVKYILRNARVLKRMEIYCQKKHEFDFKAKFEALQRISLFPRASKACELAFY